MSVMMANNSSAMMRHQHESAAAVAAAASAQHQKSYIGGGGSGGGGGAGGSSLVGEAGLSVPYNGKPQVCSQVSGGVYESSGPVPRFQPNLHGISLEWTPEEQAILDEGLIKYANESNIVRYAKIAVQLKNKTVRDVALRCKWIAKRDISKRRKPDLNLAGKGKLKDKASDPSVMSTHAAMNQGFGAYSQGGITNNHDARFSYAAVGGLTGKLLQQNAQFFERISANMASHQMHENIGLLIQARANLLQILSNLSDPPNVLKRMPPLPVKIDEDLASSILPSSLQMQR